MTINKIDMETSGMYYSQDHFPIVHASMKSNLVTDFYGTDNKEDYEINLKRLPSDWRYRNETIQYRFNSVGLRMDNELPVDDYIVGFGCSHTVGVGVNVEDTWIHQLANKLSVNYINAGVSGGSSKLCSINFFNMLEQLQQLPKCVVFAWPSSVRYCFYTKGEFLFYLPRYINKEFEYESEIYKNMIMTDTLDSEFIFYRNMVKTTCKRLNIPYTEFSFDGYDTLFKRLNIKQVYTEINDRDLNTDFARDVRDKNGANRFSHPGVGLHKQASDYVLSYLDSVSR